MAAQSQVAEIHAADGSACETRLDPDTHAACVERDLTQIILIHEGTQWSKSLGQFCTNRENNSRAWLGLYCDQVSERAHCLFVCVVATDAASVLPATPTTPYQPVSAAVSEPTQSCRQESVRGITWPRTNSSTWATAYCSDSSGTPTQCASRGISKVKVKMSKVYFACFLKQTEDVIWQ